MISQTNSSDLDFFFDIEEAASDLDCPRTMEGVIDNLERRRENVISGGVNCIPLPFERFRQDIPGIEQGQYVVVTANQKTGKCFGKGTRIRMADNTIKKIEDIKIGDMVMSPNSEPPKQVLSTCSGKEQLYRIHSNMRDDFVVNESHIMYLYKRAGFRRKPRYYTMTVKELVDIQSSIKHFSDNYRMVASDECEFGFHVNLPIDPYFYGLWLGDGSTKGTDITTADPEIIDYLRSYANRLGMELSVYKHTTGCDRYNIKRKSHTDSIGFKGILLPVTGNQKEHINRDYLNASISDRYRLLAGLIDSDGYLNKHHTGYQITMKYLSCIEDIQELARSLGITTNIRVKYNKKLNKNYYILCLSGKNCVKIPVLLPRKKCKLSSKEYRHFSFSIEPIGEGEYYGLTLGVIIYFYWKITQSFIIVN